MPDRENRNPPDTVFSRRQATVRLLDSRDQARRLSIDGAIPSTLGSSPAIGLTGRRALNEHLEHPEGAVVFEHACKIALEGIVSKRLGSRDRAAGHRIG